MKVPSHEFSTSTHGCYQEFNSWCYHAKDIAGTYTLSTVTRYMHAHHVPHAEHVERSDEIVKRSRDDVEDFVDVSGTLCCPPPVLFTAQRAKLSCIFNGQNYL